MDLANVEVQSQFLSPTRVTASTASCLDFIAFDHSVAIKDYALSNLLISDHFPVIASVQTSVPPALTPILRRSFKDTNYSELGTKLDNISITHVTNVAQLDEQLANWHSQVTSLLDVHAPYRSFPRKNNSIPSNKLTRELVNQRNILANNIKKTNDSSAVDSLIIQVKNLNRRIKSRNRATLKSNANVAMSTNNTKDAWQFINKAMFRQPKHSNSTQLPDVAKLSDYFNDLVTENRTATACSLAHNPLTD